MIHMKDLKEMRNMEISRIEQEFERIGAHSHIKSLGLDEEKTAQFKADGMVGQEKAREAAGLVVDLIKEGQMAGRAILLAGPPGSGKTAIAVGISKELGYDVPFVSITGSEIYSAEVKKTESLRRSLRKAIGVRLREEREVLEGEVTEFIPSKGKTAYRQTIEGAELTLKTNDEEVSFEVGPRTAQSLSKQQVQEGHVIMIDKETGKVQTKGVSDKAPQSAQYDVGGKPTVPRPDGPVEKEREFVQTTALYELDKLFRRRRSGLGGGLAALFGGGTERKEIGKEIRDKVDNWVEKRIEKGTAEILPGVLFIDGVNMFDIEAFSFLNRALESEFAPIVIMASNRGITEIRGTNIKAPHGMPLDLLDRSLIITTHPYKEEVIKQILTIRAEEEDVSLTDDALELLTEYGEENSLRYSVWLLAPAASRARHNGRDEVSVEDVQSVEERFASIGESIEHIEEFEEQFLK